MRKTIGAEYFIQLKAQIVLIIKKITGSLGENVVRDGTTAASLEDIKIVVPLKNLSNFMFNIDFLMINVEIELILKWSEECVVTGKEIRQALPSGDDPAAKPAVAIQHHRLQIVCSCSNFTRKI